MVPNDFAPDAAPQKNSGTAPHNPQLRRRWERLPIAIPVFVRGSDDRGKEFVDFTTAININAGGMLLVSRRPLPPGSELSLEIPTPTPYFHPPGMISQNAMPARVLYMTFAEGYNLCGTEFRRPLIEEGDSA
jgi:PilZ domain